MGRFFSVFIMSFALWAQSQPQSLLDRIDPIMYRSHTEARLDVALLYYGDFWGESELKRMATLLKSRFEAATNGLVKLNITLIKTLPFKYPFADHSSFRIGDVTDPARLERMWYYDYVNKGIAYEVREQLLITVPREEIQNLDAVLVLTGAQFEGLAHTIGRMVVVEQPREIAWGTPGGGSTEVNSDETVVDELIHELGHVMFLQHSSYQCMADGLTIDEQNKCCQESPNRRDVMSYCRPKREISKDVFFKFETCNLKMIQEKVVPALLNGTNWNIQGRVNCE
jgi:hypothetical protein